LTDADRKSYQAGHNAGVKHQKQITKREWVGLTHEELIEIHNQKDWDITYGWDYEQAIEAKLKEKNT
jgi:hypothetical protein